MTGATKQTRLYAEDIGVLRGISPRRARAYLARLEEKHGPLVVGTDFGGGKGRPRRFTTMAALSRVVLDERGRDEDEGRPLRMSDLEAMIRSVAEDLADLSRRVERLAGTGS